MLAERILCDERTAEGKQTPHIAKLRNVIARCKTMPIVFSLLQLISAVVCSARRTGGLDNFLRLCLPHVVITSVLNYLPLHSSETSDLKNVSLLFNVIQHWQDPLRQADLE